LFIPFLPFLFLGVIFVGHGTLALVLSLVVSAILTAGISFLLLRRRTGSDTPLAGAFVAPATSAGLEGVLQLDAVGLHWMPRARLPLWFIPWSDVVRTAVREMGEASELHVELVGSDTLTLIVDAAAMELERALGRAGVPKPR
jgi:hypothetical protein